MRRAAATVLGLVMLATAGCRVDDPTPDQLYSPALAPPLPRHDVLYDIAYGPDEHQVLDIYVPKKRTGGRTLVWFHGGGWEGGSKSDLAATVPFVLSLLNERWTIVAVDYALHTPDSTSGLVGTDDVDPSVAPDALTDARDAIAWLGANAKLLGINPNRIVVGGDSAGGLLAAQLGTMGTGSSTGVRGWVGLDAPMDLAALSESTQPYLGDLTVSRAVAALFECRYDLDEYRADCPVALLDHYSPLQQLDAADPPGFLVAGAWDDLVVAADHAEPMEVRAGEVGAIVALDLVDTGDGAAFRHNATQRGMHYAALKAWLGAITG